MSKKKSYMDKGNILTEDIISAFFRGLFTGRKSLNNSEFKQKEKEFRKKTKKSVDDFNDAMDQMYSAINKIRKSNGDKPKKAPKVTVDQIVKQAKAGKYK